MSNYPQQHAQQQQPAQQMPYPTHPAPGPGMPPQGAPQQFHPQQQGQPYPQQQGQPYPQHMMTGPPAYPNPQAPPHAIPPQFATSTPALGSSIGQLTATTSTGRGGVPPPRPKTAPPPRPTSALPQAPSSPAIMTNAPHLQSNNQYPQQPSPFGSQHPQQPPQYPSQPIAYAGQGQPQPLPQQAPLPQQSVYPQQPQQSPMLSQHPPQNAYPQQPQQSPMISHQPQQGGYPQQPQQSPMPQQNVYPPQPQQSPMMSQPLRPNANPQQPNQMQSPQQPAQFQPPPPQQQQPQHMSPYPAPMQTAPPQQPIQPQPFQPPPAGGAQPSPAQQRNAVSSAPSQPKGDQVPAIPAPFASQPRQQAFVNAALNEKWKFPVDFITGFAVLPPHDKMKSKDLKTVCKVRVVPGECRLAVLDDADHLVESIPLAGAAIEDKFKIQWHLYIKNSGKGDIVCDIPFFQMNTCTAWKIAIADVIAGKSASVAAPPLVQGTEVAMAHTAYAANGELDYSFLSFKEGDMFILMKPPIALRGWHYVKRGTETGFIPNTMVTVYRATAMLDDIPDKLAQFAAENGLRDPLPSSAPRVPSGGASSGGGGLRRSRSTGNITTINEPVAAAAAPHGVVHRKASSTSLVDHNMVNIIWEWRNNMGLFRPYDITVQKQLEDAYKQKLPSVQLTIDAASYKIDFANMFQESLGPDKTQSAIRRIDLLQPQSPLNFPAPNVQAPPQVSGFSLPGGANMVMTNPQPGFTGTSGPQQQAPPPMGPPLATGAPPPMIVNPQPMQSPLMGFPDAGAVTQGPGGWFWEDDGGQFMPYDAAGSQAVTAAFMADKSSVEIGNGTYVVDLVNLEQVRKENKKVRRISFDLLHAAKCTRDSYFAWSWFDGQIFRPYPPKITFVINRFLSNGMPQNKVFRVCMNNVWFLIDCIQMLQVHIQNNSTRPIMCGHSSKTMNSSPTPQAPMLTNPTNSNSAGAPFSPQRLEASASGPNLQLIDLPPHNDEFKQVSAQFKKTLNKNIMNIKKIVNRRLQMLFDLELDMVRQKNEPNMQLTRMLFHGTSKTDPSLIYNGEKGFMLQFAAEGMWGRGTYFAENAMYSNDYSFKTTKGESQMFLAQVIVGDCHVCPSDRSLRIPPVRPSKSKDVNFAVERYDSVGGFTNGSNVFIVFDNNKAYPAFLITYK